MHPKKCVLQHLKYNHEVFLPYYLSSCLVPQTPPGVHISERVQRQTRVCALPVLMYVCLMSSGAWPDHVHRDHDTGSHFLLFIVASQLQTGYEAAMAAVRRWTLRRRGMRHFTRRTWGARRAPPPAGAWVLPQARSIRKVTPLCRAAAPPRATARSLPSWGKGPMALPAPPLAGAGT